MSPARKVADDVAEWVAHSPLAVSAFRILLVFSAFAFWSVYTDAKKKIDDIPAIQASQEQLRQLIEIRTSDRFTGAQGALLERRIESLERRIERLDRRLNNERRDP